MYVIGEGKSGNRSKEVQDSLAADLNFHSQAGNKLNNFKIKQFSTSSS